MRTPRSSAHCSRYQRQGSAIVEFTLVATFIFLPILAGAGTVGVSLITAMQVANLNANAGQMFSSGVDFTQATNVSILTNLAGNLNNTAGSGYVVVLSEIDISAAGVPALAQQIVLGNAALSANVPDPTQVVSGMTTLPAALAALAGQPAEPYTAFVAQTYFDNSPYAWVFAAAGTGTGIYVQNIF